MFIKREGSDPKPEKKEKPKYRKIRKVSKKVLEKMDKKESVKQLQNDLDDVFSTYIRQKGMDEKGFNFCYTCGKHDHWKKLQNGHYISRKYNGTRWEENNCRPQCVKCNIFSEGNKPAFARKFLKEFGESYLDELEILKNRTIKIDAFTLQLLINDYKSKIK